MTTNEASFILLDRRQLYMLLVFQYVLCAFVSSHDILTFLPIFFFRI